MQPIANDREREVSVRYGLPARYVLQVGTIERRKNLGLTVKALGSLPEDLHLVAIGRETEYADRVRHIARQTGVADRVHFLHDIPFVDLPHIYRRAEAIAYPSRYEGFGIPVIEGLASRRPVIAATGSCLEEAGGDAAIYVAPDDPRGMAEALRSVTDGSCDTTGMISRGLKHIERFRNSDIASHVHYIYEKTLAGRRR